ncbi:MAG: SO_0444 family Cu/Zn efflux transporter, partial [Sedimentisphaerales bacterium]|nr:SO_0444 family Cu/Zn efflux transporter [Sedimentisphaerales bacterium]
MAYLHAYIYELWHILLELAPWLLLGMLIAGLLHVLLPAGFVRRHLGGGLWGGVFKAVAMGVPLPLCSCGVIPAALGLRKDGASKGAAVGFLISTPQTGVDSILVSATFLGWPFALFKVAAALASGMVGGILTGYFVGENGITNPSSENNRGQDAHDTKMVTRRRCRPEAGGTRIPATRGGRRYEDDRDTRGMRELVRFGFIQLLGDVYRWLILGIVIAAAVATFIPEGKLADYKWVQGPLGMLLVLLASMPMYICAVASVPLAASLVAAGLPAGAALVLLMAGPTTNVATMGAILRGLGRGALAVYLATVAVMSFGLGWLFNFILPARPDIGGHVHPLPEWINISAAVALLGLLGYFVVRDVYHRRQRPEGMACCHEEAASAATKETCCCHD